MDKLKEQKLLRHLQSERHNARLEPTIRHQIIPKSAEPSKLSNANFNIQAYFSSPKHKSIEKT